LTENGKPGWSLDVAGRCEQKHPLKRHGTMDDYGIKSYKFIFVIF
jgi:hypothetical protein